MKSILLGGVGLVALILFSLWLNSRPFWNGSASAAVITIPRMSFHSDGAFGTTTSRTLQKVTIDGTVIIDRSSGLPNVPYIKYTDQNGRLATKQLIYAGERGCSPTSGDLPCVPGYPADAAYPQLNDGQHISAQGYVYANRLLVTAIQEK